MTYLEYKTVIMSIPTTVGILAMIYLAGYFFVKGFKSGLKHEGPKFGPYDPKNPYGTYTKESK